MKLRQIIVLTGIVFCTQTAFANVALQTFGKGLGQSCSNFAGRWVGSGTVKATVIFPITCQYKGVADAALSGSGSDEFNVHVELTKTDGICPDHESVDLPGTCINGVVNLHTDKANLQGDINDAGNEARLEGSVTVSLYGKNINADVRDMVLHKQ